MYRRFGRTGTSRPLYVKVELLARVDRSVLNPNEIYGCIIHHSRADEIEMAARTTKARCTADRSFVLGIVIRGGIIVPWSPAKVLSADEILR